MRRLTRWPFRTEPRGNLLARRTTCAVLTTSPMGAPLFHLTPHAYPLSLLIAPSSRSHPPRSDSNLLRPVSIEGESILCCVVYVPLSLLLLFLAACTRSALDGVACSLDLRLCVAANGIPALPIGLGLPLNRIEPPLPIESKTIDFSLATPSQHGRCTTYRHSLFVVTSRGSTGWETLSLYEIIACGAVPYLLGLDDCPSYTLHSLPRALLRRVQALPHLPPAAEILRAVSVLSGSSTPRTRHRGSRHNTTAEGAAPPRLALRAKREDPRLVEEYQALVYLLRDHARTHMTTLALARRVVSALDASPVDNATRALLLSSPQYDPCLIALHHGLATLGAKVHALPDMPALYRHLEGRGSHHQTVGSLFQHSLPPRKHRSPSGRDVDKLLRDGAYHIVVVFLATEAINTAHGALLAHFDRKRILCVRSDSNPPAAWMIWAPDFCSHIMIREMHFGW